MKAGQNQRKNHSGHIQDAAQPFPSLALRIEKYLFIRHDGWSSFTQRRENPAETVYAIQYESYGSCSPESIDDSRPDSFAAPGRPASLSRWPRWPPAWRLRLWMLKQFFQVNGDSLIYGGLAKNLLLHGRYALTGGGGEIYSTLIRLPGYPLFLALCFRLFGMENYCSAAWCRLRSNWPAACCWPILSAASRRRSLKMAPRTAPCGWPPCAPSRRSMPSSRSLKPLRCLCSPWRCGPWRASGTGLDGPRRSLSPLRSPLPRCCGPMARWLPSPLPRRCSLPLRVQIPSAPNSRNEQGAPPSPRVCFCG